MEGNADMATIEEIAEKYEKLALADLNAGAYIHVCVNDGKEHHPYFAKQISIHTLKRLQEKNLVKCAYDGDKTRTYTLKD